MGMAGTRFGKNAPPSFTPTSTAELPSDLLTPNPFLVAQTLLNRNGTFQPAEGINLLIVAWLQFQNHDWFNHGRDDSVPPLCIPRAFVAPPGSGAGCFNLSRTAASTRPGTFLNTETHWWDASQIYGSDSVTQAGLRTFEGGRLRVVKGPFGETRLPRDKETGLPLTGFSENWWMGLSLLHTLFAAEHNAVAGAIQVRKTSFFPAPIT